MKRMQKIMTAGVVLGFAVVSVDAFACGVFQRQSQTNCGKSDTSTVGTVLVPTKAAQVYQGGAQQQQTQWAKPSQQDWFPGKQVQQTVPANQTVVTTTPVQGQVPPPVVVTPIHTQTQTVGQIPAQSPMQSPVQQVVIPTPSSVKQRPQGSMVPVYPGTSNGQAYQPYQPYQPTQPTQTAQPAQPAQPVQPYQPSTSAVPMTNNQGGSYQAQPVTNTNQPARPAGSVPHM